MTRFWACSTIELATTTAPSGRVSGSSNTKPTTGARNEIARPLGLAAQRLSNLTNAVNFRLMAIVIVKQFE